MDPSVTLAPWELPLDCVVPLTAPADFVFQAPWQQDYRKGKRKTEIWVRRVTNKNELLYYFCDGHHPHNGNWILTDLEPHQTYWPERDNSLSEVNETTLAGWFRDNHSLWADHVVRHVYFEGEPYGHPGTHRLTIRANGICSVNRASSSTLGLGNAGALFGSPFNPAIPENASTMRRQLLDLLNNEFSELRFTFNWLYLTHEQKRALLLRVKRGTITEVEILLRAVLQSDTRIWTQEEPMIWRTRTQTHAPDLSEMRLMLASNPYPVLPHLPYLTQTPPRLIKWQQAIWNFFGPSLNEELMRFSECARYSWNVHAVLEIKAMPPSYHEQLEALLLLRDWWKLHFPTHPFELQNADDTQDTNALE